jgi:AAA15 family ATPase/GTPase
MFKNLKIKNFRGINDLEINGFNKINLFLGKNNSGKTSILEAIFLTIGASNPSLNVIVNNFRGLTHTEVDDFRFIFKDLDYHFPIKLEAIDIHKALRVLEIKPIYSQPANGINIENPNKLLTSDSIISLQEVTGLELNLSINKKKYVSKVEVNYPKSMNNLINYIFTTPQKYKEEYQGNYLTPSSNDIGLAQKIEKLIVDKSLKPIITSLKKIDNNITDIKLGANGMIYFDVNGIEKLLPLNIMGDGIRRILSILVTIILNKNGMVMIDEIENGLHYSAIANLWKTLITFSIDNNVQLFVTSHRYEILKCLNDVLKNEKQSIKENVASFSIRKNEEIIKAYRYLYEDFNNAIIEGIEIR